jgi:hypothetical protein
MKTKISLGLILLASIFSGCKDGKSVDDLKVVKPEADPNFIVTIDVIAKKNDDFALYYTVDGSINFFSIPPVWQGFKGSESIQQITFVVPEQTFPTQIRLDFGMKQNQPDIVLQKIKMSHNGKDFIISGPDIFKYFVADPNQCTADPATGTIKANMKDGKRLTPSIYPNPDALGKGIKTIE